MKAAIEAIVHIEIALNAIDRAIKEDPAHVDWYLSAKDELISADSALTFCIED